jgi:hypothetical protein
MLFHSGSSAPPVKLSTGEVGILTAAFFTVSLSAPAVAGGVKEPCALLSLDQVQQVFPDASTSRAEMSLKQYGILACDWLTASGARLVQLRISSGSSVDDELSTFAMGMSDPLKPSKLQADLLTGLPEKAGALVVGQGEAENTPPTAVLILQHGPDTIGVATTAMGDRNKADIKAALSPLLRAAYENY